MEIVHKGKNRSKSRNNNYLTSNEFNRNHLHLNKKSLDDFSDIEKVLSSISKIEEEPQVWNFLTHRTSKRKDLNTSLVDSVHLFSPSKKRPLMNSRVNSSVEYTEDEVSKHIIDCVNTSNSLEKQFQDLKASYQFTDDDLDSNSKLSSRLESVREEFKRNETKLQDAYEELEQLKEQPNYRYQRAKQILFDYTEYAQDRDDWRQLPLASKDLVQSKEFKRLLTKIDGKSFSIFYEDEEEKEEALGLADEL